LVTSLGRQASLMIKVNPSLQLGHLLEQGLNDRFSKKHFLGPEMLEKRRRINVGGPGNLACACPMQAAPRKRLLSRSDDLLLAFLAAAMSAAEPGPPVLGWLSRVTVARDFGIVAAGSTAPSSFVRIHMTFAAPRSGGRPLIVRLRFLD
jgi:hypothetical protein